MRNESAFSYARDNYQKFFYTINRKNYLFRATFVNADGVVVDFQKDAIKDLFLQDQIYNPFVNGHIVIDNTEDVIERYKLSPQSSEFVDNIGERGYKTRGDARDILLLSIIPVDPSTNPYNEQSLDYNKVFGFQYVFILSNEVDVLSKTGKLKKYTIDDYDFEILKEKKIFFSTVNLLKKDKIAFLSDNDRQAYTGDCLKYILQKGLNNPQAVFTTLSGSNEVAPNFESGASQLFYSSPNNFTALNDLMYMYALHVSNSPGKDFSFLSKDDYTGEYTLESASSIFQKAFNKQDDSGGQYFIENLTIAGAQDNNNVIENDIKKPLIALELGETSDIVDVKFFNTPGQEWQNNIKTTLVHSYNFERKTFDINSVDGDIQRVKEDFSKLYVAPMKGRDNKPSPNFIINNTQKTNQNFDNKFLIYSEDSDALKLAFGRNELLKDALKLNLGVEITVQGGFQRKSGKFISIDRTGSYVDNDFDNKFLGIYFILQVDHIFKDNNSYYNKILAVKTYHFNDPKINENIS